MTASCRSAQLHEIVHVRDYGMAAAPDEQVMECAAREDRVLVSADADFGTLLAVRGTDRPSVILFRRGTDRRPDQQAALLLANLEPSAPLLAQGSVLVFEDRRLRTRRLPIGRSDGRDE